jgi:hypothetical protein
MWSYLQCVSTEWGGKVVMAGGDQKSYVRQVNRSRRKWQQSEKCVCVCVSSSSFRECVPHTVGSSRRCATTADPPASFSSVARLTARRNNGIIISLDNLNITNFSTKTLGISGEGPFFQRYSFAATKAHAIIACYRIPTVICLCQRVWFATDSESASESYGRQCGLM